MKKYLKRLLKTDFERWSGGFPPESDNQITVYIDYALSRSFDPREARWFLQDWMNDPTAFDEKAFRAAIRVVTSSY